MPAALALVRALQHERRVGRTRRLPLPDRWRRFGVSPFVAGTPFFGLDGWIAALIMTTD